MKSTARKGFALLLSILFTLNLFPINTLAAEVSENKLAYSRINNASIWSDYEENTGDLYVIMAYDNINQIVVSKVNLKDNVYGVYDGIFKNVSVPRYTKYSNEYWQYLKSYVKENATSLSLNPQTVSPTIATRGVNEANAAISTKIRQTFGNEYNNVIKTDTASYPGITIKIWEKFDTPYLRYNMVQIYAGWYITSAIANIAEIMGLTITQALSEALHDLCDDIINTAFNTFDINAKVYPYMCSITRTRYGMVNNLNIAFSEAYHDRDFIGLYCDEELRAVLKEHARSYFPTYYAYESPGHVWLTNETYAAYQNYI